MSSTNGIGSLRTVVNSIVTGETKSTQTQSNSTAARTNTAATSTDQANFSPTGSLIAQALSSDDVRADKVAALREAIASGSYKVSSFDVADKLIQSLLK
jgi:negative regulator of flagellin synthesis FlgM